MDKEIQVFESAIEAMRFLKSQLHSLSKSSLHKAYLAYDGYCENFIVTVGDQAGYKLTGYIEKEFYKDPDDANHFAREFTVWQYVVTTETAEYPFTFKNARPAKLFGGTKYSRAKWGIEPEYSVSFHII